MKTSCTGLRDAAVFGAEAERAAALHHIAGCRSCRAWVGTAQRLATLVEQSSPPEADRATLERIWRSIAPGLDAAVEPRRRARWLVIALSLTGTLALAAVLWL